MSKITLVILSVLVSIGPVFINKLISTQPVMTMVSAAEPAPTDIVTTNRPSAIGDPEFDIFYNGSIRGDLGEMTSGGQARTVTLLNRERREHL